MDRRKIILLLLIILGVNTHSDAGGKAIGQWQSHLPYRSAVSIATDGVRMYVATRYSFYIYDIADESVESYSKVNGMSDVSMSKIAYDTMTDAVVLGYTNSNIDIFKNGVFYNIPDLKLKTVAGTKSINNILARDGLAYVSTDIGIVVLNLDKAEVKETYAFTKNNETVRISGTAISGNEIYAATNIGLFKAPLSGKNLQSFSAWTALDTLRDFRTITYTGSKIFLSQPDSVFAVENDVLVNIYHTDDSVIRAVQQGINSVWVLEYYDTIFNGKAKRIDMNYTLTDSFMTTGVADEMIDFPDADSSKWVANYYDGLKKRKGKGEPFNTVVPDGPGDVSSFDISIGDKALAVAHGAYDDKYRPLDIASGFSVYQNDKWKNYRLFEYAPFGDSIKDITELLQAPDGTIYAGSSQSGLFILKPDGSYEYYKQNSFIDPSSTGGNLYRVSGIARDNDGVIWLTVFGGSPHELVARTTDGNWKQISVPASRGIAHSAAKIIVDENNQKWFAAPPDGGIIVYDDNQTPELETDDEYIQLFAGEGSGGLPDNQVFCMVSDKSGAIWIGTNNGIGIVNCPSQVIQRQCEAEKRIVQFDQFAGYLFQNEQVRAIAVDGANRKWIGTNNGVWLISPSGDAIIERFTKDNSPLPSDIIQKISVDPKTGDVYIGTELGLVSYRGTAIDGGEKNDELITFPNPVPSGYTGTIAIKGFVENADVRITDISGQLVYRTTALGGQAVWNGKDYTGNRPQSGVYLIFATDKTGTQKAKGKLVLME